MGNIDVKERKISSRASDESKKKIPYHKLKIKFERFESYIRKCKAFFFFFHFPKLQQVREKKV